MLLVLSFMRYKPPTYGSYRYPASAQVIGWSVAIAIVMPILVVFVYKMAATPGSLSKASWRGKYLINKILDAK